MGPGNNAKQDDWALKPYADPFSRAAGSLESSAPALILRPASGIALKEGERVWEICPIRPGAGQLYLDSTNVVKSIKSWAEVRCRYVGHPRRSHALPALFVSGLMKVRTCLYKCACSYLLFNCMLT